MRYRPFGQHGAAVSAVSLVLTDAPVKPDERVGLVYAALEAGINTFELQGGDPEAALALGEALSSVDRRMVFVAARLGWTRDSRGKPVRDLGANGLTGAIEAILAQSRLGRLDVALLDAQADEVLPPHVIAELEQARAAGTVRMLGIAGGDAVDPHLATGAFQVLATAFNIQSGWRERNRLKRAAEADMPVMGCDFFPAALRGGPVEEARPAGPLKLSRLFGGARKPQRGPYAFLDRAPDWTAEQVCLGYALTEPSLATVQVAIRDPARLKALAEVCERELPTGIAAQIEMARFSADEKRGAA